MHLDVQIDYGVLFSDMIGVEMCEFGWLFTSCLPLHETLGFLQNVCVHTSFGRGDYLFFS